jgi:hypothetical protein
MAISGLSGGNGPSGPNKVIIVNFQPPGHPDRGINNSATASINTLRANAEELSKRDDPFQELATRLTNFFSNPESDNNKAQEIKNACWNDLTEARKPVFRPDFANLRNAQFFESPEGLTITLDPGHVDQGYLQVLADLTLVAEMIKRSIDKDAEDSIGGFNSHPIEKIKIISHPDRNLTLSSPEIIKRSDYQLGPEFKFIESEAYGLIPVANGMFNLNDVQEGKLSTPNNNNNHLEEFAFNGKDSLHNPLSHVYNFNRSYLTPQNTIFISPPMDERMNGFRAVRYAYGYGTLEAELETRLRNHNQGPIIDHLGIPPRYLHRTIDTYGRDPSYTRAIRHMAQYQPADSDGRSRPDFQEEVEMNPDTQALLEIDALGLQRNNGTSPLKRREDIYITTKFAKKHYNGDTMKMIFN